METLTAKSKYKYLEGRPSKENFSNLNLSQLNFQGDFISSNGVWVALPWNVGGGGKVMVRRADQFGKIQNTDPAIIGHSGQVSDTAFSPFNDFLLSTASQDGTIKLWDLPVEGNLTENLKTELSSLNGHSSKVQLLSWHVNAENILASTSSIGQLLIWDVTKEDPIFELQPIKQGTNSLKWNRNGSLLAMTHRDKKIRVCDPRASDIVNEWEGHKGSQAQKIQFIGENTLLSIGMSKVNEQEFGGWDLRNTSQPAFLKVGSTGKRVTRPYVIQDNNILLTVTQGESTIQFYEILNEEPYLDKLMGWGGKNEHIGFQLLPTRMCDEKQCIIAKAARLSSKYAHFVSFAVPRKAATLQKDLFPPCPSYLPSLSAEKWGSGETLDTVRMMWGKSDFERICYPNKNQSQMNKLESAGIDEEVKSKLADMSNEIKEKNEQIAKLKQELKQALEKQAEQEETIKTMGQQIEDLNFQVNQQEQHHHQPQEQYHEQPQEQHHQVEQPPNQPIPEQLNPEQHHQPQQDQKQEPLEPEKPVFQDQQQQEQFEKSEQPGSVYQSIMQGQPIQQEEEQPQQQQGGYEQEFINQYGENQANQQQYYNQNEYNYEGGADASDAQ